jgi:hypothetical protein
VEGRYGGAGIRMGRREEVMEHGVGTEGGGRWGGKDEVVMCRRNDKKSGSGTWMNLG